MPGEDPPRLAKAQASSLTCLQIGANPLNCSRSGFSSLAKIKNKPRVFNSLASEFCSSHTAIFQELFYIAKNMHGKSSPFDWRLGVRFISNTIPTCLGKFLRLIHKS